MRSEYRVETLVNRRLNLIFVRHSDVGLRFATLLTDILNAHRRLL